MAGTQPDMAMESAKHHTQKVLAEALNLINSTPYNNVADPAYVGAVVVALNQQYMFWLERTQPRIQGGPPGR